MAQRSKVKVICKYVNQSYFNPENQLNTYGKVPSLYLLSFKRSSVELSRETLLHVLLRKKVFFLYLPKNDIHKPINTKFSNGLDHYIIYIDLGTRVHPNSLMYL